jgi:hypothetical protein
VVAEAPAVPVSRGRGIGPVTSRGRVERV